MPELGLCSGEYVKELQRVTRVLDDLYEKYSHPQFIPPDPLQWVYKYKSNADREIVGFIASSLAYGRVEQINKSLAKIFKIMGPHPAEFVKNFSAGKRELFRNFKHRFNTGEDIADLLELLGFALHRAGSIEKYFSAGLSASDQTIIPALTLFCESLLDEQRKRKGGINPGLGYLLTSPRAGSACKRLNLYLRWMVRSDEVDPGVWKQVPRSKLIVPLDVHMGRLTRILGFHHKATLNLSTAVQVTEGFGKITADDPVKYDFSLCRIGILEGCTGKFATHCRECKLWSYCRK